MLWTFGRPDSSVGKTVCLCLTTSYIPLPQEFESCWRHASKKKYRVVKKIYQWKSLRNVWVVTVPAGLRWFHSISWAAENYPGFPPPQDSRAKCVFRSRIAWFDIDSVSSAKFQLRPPYGFWADDFFNIFFKFNLLVIRYPPHVDAICVIWLKSASWLQRRCRLKMRPGDYDRRRRRTDNGCLAIL